ncbi:MAG: chemotaxis protein CheX [Pseudomonadota bacterium]|nr:chemotaxis protein CheX [Pseudomonadota bacterium]
MDNFSLGLSELELDALTELVNLGVSNAALSLREMVRGEVLLSVPEVSIVTRDEAIVILGDTASARLVAVQQHFEGDINGRALLIFPETKSLELVRAVVGGTPSLEDVVELEHEALAETGNVLLNGCLGTIANGLQRNLRISLPEVVYGNGTELFTDTPGHIAGNGVLFIYINFAVRHGDITGYIAMLLDIPSLLTLKELLAAYIARVAGTPLAQSSDASR